MADKRNGSIKHSNVSLAYSTTNNDHLPLPCWGHSFPTKPVVQQGWEGLPTPDGIQGSPGGGGGMLSKKTP